MAALVVGLAVTEIGLRILGISYPSFRVADFYRVLSRIGKSSAR
jgi:hypothetical protein